MVLQIVLNILLSIVWMLLSNEWGFASFFGGYSIGLLILLILHRFFDKPFYLVKVWAVIKLLLLFLKELVLANLAVIRHVLRPKMNFRPGIFSFDTELETDLEITILTGLITLTPGTLSLEVSPDQKTIFIHAMDIEEAEQAAREIKMTFEKAIMEVTR